METEMKKMMKAVAILSCILLPANGFAASGGQPDQTPASTNQPEQTAQGAPASLPANTSHKLGQQGIVLGQDQTQPSVQQSAQQANVQAQHNEQGQNKQGEPGSDAQALFEESLRQMMPLSKEQIQEYREWSDQRDRALLPVAPSLKSRTVRVTLEPGKAPITVATTGNIATSLVFHDTTGQPWPITSVTNGSPQFFQILRPELPDGNLLNVMPVQAYGSANIVVTLAKHDIPLVIKLESDSVRSPVRNADGLVLFQLAHYGPNAQPPLTKDIKETASSAMLAFLDHVPPAESVRVRTEPKDEKTTIWKFQDQHYIRTTHTLMWPAWTSVVNGAGGIKCYEAPVTPRLLLSKNGEIETVVLKGSAQ